MHSVLRLRHRIHALAAALAAFCLAACSSDSRAPAAATEEAPDLGGPRNILLLTVDTLRADHLSAYGYPRLTSPRLDQLASEGVRFEMANVQWPKTGPSFASMFTATYPSDNGIVRQVGIELPCSFRMLAEELQERGYSNHAIVSNGAVAAELRFDQGFDSYVESWKLDAEPGVDKNGAEFVTEQALAALERLPTDRPWLLWVHYLDPHFPYTPPEPFTDRFQDDEYFDPSETFEVADNPHQQVVQVGYDRVLDGRTDLAFYEARYDAEILYTDGQIDRLLGTMEAKGLLDGTLTVMTSDHGESLGEHHYYFDHGRFAYDTNLRVPLIFHLPGVLEPRVVETPVPLVDLTPTLLEAAGAELDGGRYMQGRSLLPLLFGLERNPDPRAALEGSTGDGAVSTTTGGETRGEPVYSEAGFADDGAWQRVARDGRYKLIYARARSEQIFLGGEGVLFTLFDLENDPGETENVAEEHPEALERLKRALWRHTRDEAFDVRVDSAEGCADFSGMDSETESQLRALGYLQ